MYSYIIASDSIVLIPLTLAYIYYICTQNTPIYSHYMYVSLL